MRASINYYKTKQVDTIVGNMMVVFFSSLSTCMGDERSEIAENYIQNKMEQRGPIQGKAAVRCANPYN